MLPRPKELPSITVELASDKERSQLGVRMVENLTAVELQCKDIVYAMLNAKWRKDEREIDIQKMVHHFQTGRGKPLTEYMCRRLINKYEHDYINWYYFIIKNGDSDWKESDEIRNAQVQKKLDGAIA